MKKATRQVMVVLLVFVVFVAQISGVGLFSKVYAVENDAQNQYFYNQLTPEAQKFYKAMYDMYTDGTFETGTQDYDLLANGIVTEEEIVAYTKGDPQMLNAMGLARDAFEADHPEVFYVDFTLLSLTITKDSSGKYYAYLGTGRSDNYFAEGFKSQEEVKAAIEAYNNAVDTIVAGASGDVSDKVKYVHEQIINSTSYRMEGLCATGNEGFIHNSYGPLVKGEGVCEGYAQAMKVILDKLGIPCILVQGMVQEDDNSVGQLHMWNYVQIDDQWYAVDATWDDPVNQNNNVGVTDGIDGYENNKYLLASEVTMNVCHTPSGVWTAVESSAGFEFTYPALSTKELGFNAVVDDNGLLVQYKVDGEYNGLPTGEFKVSYNGMGYAEAAKNGYYILTRQYQLDKDTGEYVTSKYWGYLDPTPYGDDNDMLVDSATEITLRFPHVNYMEFAVTDIPPTITGDINTDYYYTGDTQLFLAVSDKLTNEQGSYMAPPYIASVTPSTNGRLKVGSTYEVTVTYDEDLKLADGVNLVAADSDTTSQKTTSALSCEVTTYNPDRTISNASSRCEVKNVKWDGKRTITFEFTPSEYWEDDTIMYYIQPTGIVGAVSNKAPNSVGYAASHGCVAYAYRNQGFDWNVFGKPALMDNVDYGEDTNGGKWLSSDGTDLTEQLQSLKSRLVLVTTEAATEQLAAKQEEETVNAIQQVSDDEILSSKTYNISLTLCKSQIIKTGQSIRVSVGFPEGYDSTSEGVTFKAYHFKEDGTPELVDCVVTKYGLVISCNAFSPYAIVAVKDENPSAKKDATVIVSSTTGGTVTGTDGGMLTVAEGESRSLTITADEGYQIESITVGDKNLILDSNSTSETIQVKYDYVSDGNGIVNVKFIPTSVVERTEQLHPGQTLVADPIVTVLAENPGNTGNTDDSNKADDSNKTDDSKMDDNNSNDIKLDTEKVVDNKTDVNKVSDSTKQDNNGSFAAISSSSNSAVSGKTSSAKSSTTKSSSSSNSNAYNSTAKAAATSGLSTSEAVSESSTSDDQSASTKSLDKSATTDSSAVTDTTSEPVSETGGLSPLVWGIIAVVVVAAIGGAVIIRKRKQ